MNIGSNPITSTITRDARARIKWLVLETSANTKVVFARGSNPLL